MSESGAKKPGRDEACWCGSGKRYRKCHLAIDKAAESAEQDPRKIFADVLESGVGWRLKSDLADAFEMFFERLPAEVDSEMIDTTGFLQWYVYDYRSKSSGSTLLEEYLERRGGLLTERQKTVLQAARASRFSLFEVQKPVRGSGIEVSDLCAGDSFFIHDVTSSRNLEHGDCLLTRVEFFEGRWEFPSNGMMVPRPLAGRLMEIVRGSAEAANQSPAEFVRSNSHKMHRILQNLQARSQMNRMMDAEGSPFEFSSATYAIRDEAGLLQTLREAPDFKEQQAGEDAGVRRFAWLGGESGAIRRIYGELALQSGRLRLECISRDRLARGRALLEQHAGAYLAHLSDTFESPGSLNRTRV